MNLDYCLDDFEFDDLDSVRRKLSQKEIDKFRTDFELFDEDGDGVITEEQGVRALRACGLCMSRQQLITALDQLSARRRGKVNFSQFLTVLALNLKEKPKSEEAQELREAFMVFDREKTGFLSIGEFRNVMTHLGEDMTSKEADHMIRDADMKGEGLVDIDAFVDLMCNPPAR